jgi:hypothetical protein
MSKKQNIPSFTASNLNPKAAKQLADIDKILRKTSDKDKLKLIERGLSVKPLKEDVIKTLDIKKIVRSTSFLRSEVHDPFDDLDMVAEFDPIKVVAAEGIEKLFLVDGQRRLEHTKRNGEKQIEVQIIGTVVCQSQIGMARGKQMVKFKKPLTPLEMAYGLVQLRDQIICDFGEHAFFSHGGNRKSNDDSQQSLPGYIAKALGMNKSTVDTLLRFGSNVGPMGLAGLLARDDVGGLALREINQDNALLKNANLSDQIDERLKSLTKEGASLDNLVQTAGDLAYQMIDQITIQRSKKPQIYDTDNNDDDNMDETPTDALPIPPDKGGQNNKSKPKAHKKTKTKIKPSEIINIISNIESVLKKLKNDLNKCKDVEEVDKPIFEARWKKFTEFLSNLCTKVTNAGLS